MVRRKARILLGVVFLIAVLLSSGGARAWDWRCEDNDPNPSNSYEPQQNSKLVSVYTVRNAQGRRVIVQCYYLPTEQRPPDHG